MNCKNCSKRLLRRDGERMQTFKQRQYCHLACSNNARVERYRNTRRQNEEAQPVSPETWQEPGWGIYDAQIRSTQK